MIQSNAWKISIVRFNVMVSVLTVSLPSYQALQYNSFSQLQTLYSWQNISATDKSASKSADFFGSKQFCGTIHPISTESLRNCPFQQLFNLQLRSAINSHPFWYRSSHSAPICYPNQTSSDPWISIVIHNDTFRCYSPSSETTSDWTSMNA